MPRPKPLVALHGAVNFDRLVPFDSAANSLPLANNDILVMRRAAGGDNLTLSISDINATGSVNIAQLTGGANNDMLFRVGGVWTGTGPSGLQYDGSFLELNGNDLTLDNGGQISMEGGGGITVEDGGSILLEGDGSVIVDDDGNIEVTGQGNIEQSGTGNIEISGGGSLMVSNDGNIEIEGANAKITLSSGAEMAFEGGAGIVLENGAAIEFDGDGGIVFSGAGNIEFDGAGSIDFDGNSGDVIMGSGQILAKSGTQGSPGFAFLGDEDTGIFGFGSGQVIFTSNGVQQFIVSPGSFGGTVANSPILRNLAASQTVPTIIISSSDVNTGIGSGTPDSLALIAGALDCINIAENGGAREIGFYVTTPIALQTGVAVTDVAIHAALVALGLITA